MSHGPDGGGLPVHRGRDRASLQAAPPWESIEQFQIIFSLPNQGRRRA